MLGSRYVTTSLHERDKDNTHHTIFFLFFLFFLFSLKTSKKIA